MRFLRLDMPAAVAPASPRITRLEDYQEPAFLIDQVELDFELDETATQVRSRLALRRNPMTTADAPLRLDGEGVVLKQLLLDGNPLNDGRYAVDGGAVILSQLPDRCTLQVQTEIAPIENTELSGLYVSNGSFFTQCEAEGFRRITFFPDRPDVMSRYRVSITADKAQVPVMLSNGNPGVAVDVSGGRHRITWTDPHPKPCYLFALVAGDLVAVTDSFTTHSGRQIALAIWVRRGDEDRCAHAMRSLKAAMKWDEEVFGLEYDLDVFNIAAVSDFNMGAMENKGLNIFNTKYVLARPETATDSDYQGIESVIAHEYFHNWTGNRVTCRDWFQLSLKEGLTVYRDQEFSADQGSRAVKRIGDVRGLRAGQFREDAGPFAHPVQPTSYIAIDNFYTATVYQKGAEVIRMMATIIGRDAFRTGMDLYFERHDNHAVTIDDFVAAMQDVAGVDLSAFKLWYHQAGTPEITVSGVYDAAARRYKLRIQQQTKATPGQADKKPLVIPMAMALLDSAGDPLPLRLAGETKAVGTDRLLVLSDDVSVYDFEDVPSLPTPSLFRNFSAPVRLSGLSSEQLRFLAGHDSDPFVRWDSGQQYASHALLRMVAALQNGDNPSVSDDLIATMRAALTGVTDDPAFSAEVLSLPGEGFLADQMTVVDTDAIHAVRKLARRTIGDRLFASWCELYDQLSERGVYSIDGAAMGKRALRNVCLAYIAAASTERGIALAKAQFNSRQNMTDVLAALVVLASVECPERDESLASFYRAWQNDDLVLDKWFSIQATSSLATAAVVEILSRHPAFDMRNPNRVRALIGSFATGNPVGFHSISGNGYRILGDTILALDPRNGQLAARMVGPLGQWRRVDPQRQALMRQELQRISERPGLTRNTFEMVSKSLQP
jgi:aminopeptidase N